METYEDPNPFHCIICLELVYKPIVHACGHLFCFWCVHRAMDGVYKSLCPLCRRPYMHFPRICEQLHLVLLKAVREGYLLRAKDVQEEEAKAGVFSPQFDDGLKMSTPDTMTQKNLQSDTVEQFSPMETGVVGSFEQSYETESVSLFLTSSSNFEESSPPEVISSLQAGLATESDPFDKGKSPMRDEEGQDQEDEEQLGMSETSSMSNSDMGVKVFDLTCLNCSKLLYRPVVLNCGHMLCEHCVVFRNDHTVSCPSCKAEHPGLFPQVCLELHHYIDRVFPLEYAERSLQVSHEEIEQPSKRPVLPPSELEITRKEEFRKSPPGPVHGGVGCDGCGMMPIVGKRFLCKDCTEVHKSIGYDLCEKCHESGCVVGRFNQQHTPEHQMIEVRHASRARIAMASRNGINITDLRIITHDCDDLEAMLSYNANIFNSQSVSGNGGSQGQPPEQVADADNRDAFVETSGDGSQQLDYSQDEDTNHELFVQSEGLEDFAGQEDEEFETFSRDDEDIEFYRVVFHA